MVWLAVTIFSNRILSYAESPAPIMAFAVSKYLLGAGLCMLTLHLVRALGRRQRRRAAEFWS